MFGTRHRAAATYLAASLAIAACAFVLIYGWWYPLGLFTTEGGLQLFTLIAAVGLVIGPLLIFVVFIPGKKGLWFDVAAITALQFAALGYGLYVVHASRPAYIVFVKDRFELMRANDFPEQELAQSGRFAELPLDGPRIVGARIPANRDERMRIMFASVGGVDLQHFPQHYVDYDDVRAEVRARQSPIARLKQLNPQARDEIDRLVARTGRAEGDLGFLPLRSPRHELAAIVDAKSAELLRIEALRPW